VVAPRFLAAKGILHGDNIRCSLLDDHISADLQQAQNRRFPGAGGAGEDVSGHGNSSPGDCGGLRGIRISKRTGRPSDMFSWRMIMARSGEAES
jgi:hypothetical protein